MNSDMMPKFIIQTEIGNYALFLQDTNRLIADASDNNRYLNIHGEMIKVYVRFQKHGNNWILKTDEQNKSYDSIFIQGYGDEGFNIPSRRAKTIICNTLIPEVNKFTKSKDGEIFLLNSQLTIIKYELENNERDLKKLVNQTRLKENKISKLREMKDNLIEIIKAESKIKRLN